MNVYESINCGVQLGMGLWAYKHVMSILACFFLIMKLYCFHSITKSYWFITWTAIVSLKAASKLFKNTKYYLIFIKDLKNTALDFLYTLLLSHHSLGRWWCLPVHSWGPDREHPTCPSDGAEPPCPGLLGRCQSSGNLCLACPPSGHAAHRGPSAWQGGLEPAIGWAWAGVSPQGSSLITLWESSSALSPNFLLAIHIYLIKFTCI